MKRERARRSSHARKARSGGWHVLSSRRVSPFSRGVISRALAFCSLYCPWGKWGTIRRLNCSNMSRRDFPATNRFVCNGFFCVKIFVSATEFYRRNTSQKIKSYRILRLIAATKFCCRHTKRFVAAMCRRNVLLQLVARPVHTDWYVAATCCYN